MPRDERAYFLPCLVMFAFLAPCMARSTRAQTQDTLSARIERVMARPEFIHANFGIEFYSLDSGKVIYALNAGKLFVPASTTKLLTEGSALAKLGPYDCKESSSSPVGPPLLRTKYFATLVWPIDAELEQFTTDAGRTPERVGQAHITGSTYGIQAGR